MLELDYMRSIRVSLKASGVSEDDMQKILGQDHERGYGVLYKIWLTLNGECPHIRWKDFPKYNPHILEILSNESLEQCIKAIEEISLKNREQERKEMDIRAKEYSAINPKLTSDMFPKLPGTSD